ncbi:MAG: nitroreductase family protein [Oscillospiraceae bacterium]
MDNEILKSLRERKSVRAYADIEITSEIKADIIDAALQAPTAGNMTLYSIIDVTDPAVKERLAVLCDNQPFIAKAPMILVFLADQQKWFDSFKIMYGDCVRKPRTGDYALAAADALIAAQNAVVAAESLGLGSCYIGDVIENYEGVKELLALPQFVVPAALVCFGYPTEQQKSRHKPPRFKAEYVVSENSYKQLDKTALTEMFNTKYDSTDGFDKDVAGLYERKWSQAFMLEMTRSIEKWLEAFKL